jgi:hypothetical protein
MKYLLYIDILGFSDLVKKDRSKVRQLYAAINDLNVHKHSAFKVIIFSDTVLAFPKFKPKTPDDHRYATMYMIEFTQDLFYRVAKKGIFFRAVLDYGDFVYQKMENCEKYFGKALIDSYRLEKSVPCIGTFITPRASKYQSIFPMEKYSKDLNFVYFQQDYYHFSKDFADPNMRKYWEVESLCYAYRIANEMLIFKTITKNSKSHPVDEVRLKHKNYVDYYRRKFPWPLSDWDILGYSMDKIVPSDNWKKIYPRVLKSY